MPASEAPTRVGVAPSFDAYTGRKLSRPLPVPATTRLQRNSALSRLFILVPLLLPVARDDTLQCAGGSRRGRGRWPLLDDSHSRARRARRLPCWHPIAAQGDGGRLSVGSGYVGGAWKGVGARGLLEGPPVPLDRWRLEGCGRARPGALRRD